MEIVEWSRELETPPRQTLSPYLLENTLLI
jgi:hypothetical protein